MSFSSVSSLERQVLQYQVDLERFATPALTRQRAVVDENKLEEQATLAVCAKLEKAFSRRLSLQDAEFTKKDKIVTPSIVLASPLVQETRTNQVMTQETK